MGKRNANPREGDKDIIERHGAGAMAAERRGDGDKKDTEKKGGDKAEFVPKIKVELPEEPEKPNQEVFEKEKKVIDEELDALKQKLNKFKDEMKEKNGDKDEYQKIKEAKKAELDEAHQESDRLFSEFNAVISKIKESKEASRKAERDYKDMARDVSTLGEDGIESEIRRIRYEMETKTQSLKEEKAMLKRLQALEKEKPKLEKKQRELEKLEQEREIASDQKKPLSDQADALKIELEAAKDKKKQKAQEFRELREAREKKVGNLKDQYAVMDKIREEMNTKWEELKKVKEAYKKLNDAHWDWKRACTKLKNDAWKAEEDARWDHWRSEEKKRKLEDASEKPHFAETILIEQTIAFCESLLKGNEKKEEEGEYVVPENDAFPAGARMVVPKNKRDPNEGAWHIASKKKKLKNKQKDRSGAKITLDPQSFQLFRSLDVEAPMQTSDVPECLAKLKKKMEFYEGKVAEWEKERKKLEDELEDDQKKAKESATAVVAGA